MSGIRHKIDFEDIGQVTLGSAIMATPVAFSEEAWKFGETLPIGNIVGLVFLSLLIIGFYIYHGIFQGKVNDKKTVFLGRIIIDYVATLAVVSIVLLVLNKVSLPFESFIEVKRIFVLSFPASLGAVVVDSFDKE